MPAFRRQPRIGNRRHVQIYLDEQLHQHICLLAQQEGVSFSRGARELMEIGAAHLQPTPNDSPMFTEEQVRFIEQLIDARIRASKEKSASLRNVLKDYHTVPEIRFAIIHHLDEFRQMVDSSPFPLSVLRFFLAKKLTLRPGDHEVQPKEKHGMIRFEIQVSNALSAKDWPNSPFRQSSKRGSYEFVEKSR